MREFLALASIGSIIALLAYIAGMLSQRRVTIHECPRCCAQRIADGDDE